MYLEEATEVALMGQNPECFKIDTGNTNRDSLQNCINSINGGNTDINDQLIADCRQERSLGITIISISVLFVICQSVKMVPTIYEIFLCNRKPQKLHSGESHPNVCETTDVIERFIRLVIFQICNDIRRKLL